MSDRIPRSPLPLTVIGGFLGAGKTTMLNHWLRNAGGQRLAVLVNDFGALNMDAELIEGGAGDTIALTNGCVCCQIGDDLSLALIRLLESETEFDGVVIEASGVSDPGRIAAIARADTCLHLECVFVLVDASMALEQTRDPLLVDTLARQLRAADLVVVNKCDLVTGETRRALQRWIESVAGPVSRLETTRAAVPRLGSLATRTAHAGWAHGAFKGHGHATEDHGKVFETWACRPREALDPSALRVWLRDLPAGVLRMKGLVRCAGPDGDVEWAELQFAGRRGTLRLLLSHVPRSEEAGIVAIGLRGQLPRPALDAALEKLFCPKARQS
ncbi:CobW family GTP-binding protein [Variovorax ginsengisoli]|uniref:GTP-binding protein n=1 Tax=Variovorax ginsengisoli TaxID=363844 RepID=A0ABT8SCL3_9BURK|nr:CobW family GTP-binding protein [Variovorax ginsengisoli]MDN8617483.1 GTP-binding protein [Variovorax ginsengisoli]MDO1536653.1 GTP-binding protein [Variovorax ginsengisoli]